MEIQTALSVANFFIEQKNNDNVDVLKLNKIVYIALGFSLALKDFDLFKDEVQAWKMGPVVPSVYHSFKDKKYNVLTTPAEIDGEELVPKITKEDEEIYSLLTTVWNIYRDKNGKTIMGHTHTDGTPWSVCYDGSRHKVIDRDLIKVYYKGFLKDYVKK